MTPPLATIGYEGRLQDELLDRLSVVGVELLIDVRAVASSRKAGFSKSLLAAGLKERGIGYLHLRDLGTPKAGRIAARAGLTLEMREIFTAHMRTDGARAALETALKAAEGAMGCLLCFERDHGACHRAIVADLMQARTGARVVHL
jgi:uncharacterized protein (DUF488 family)